MSVGHVTHRPRVGRAVIHRPVSVGQLLTAPVFVEQVREAHNVAEAQTEASTGHDELGLVGPQQSSFSGLAEAKSWACAGYTAPFCHAELETASQPVAINYSCSQNYFLLPQILPNISSRTVRQIITICK